MTKKISIFLILMSALFAGCSVSEALPVKEKTVITPAERSVVFPVDDMTIDHSLYEFLTQRGWKVVESANDDSPNPKEQTRFAIKYRMGWVDKSFTLEDLYTGGIGMVDRNTGELAFALRFKRKTTREIMDLFAEQFDTNIIVRSQPSLGAK